MSKRDFEEARRGLVAPFDPPVVEDERGRVITALVIVGALAVPAASATAADKDCSDFRTWRQAQNFYKNHGGPRRDPHRLDADHDGIACESLRY
jgi:Excalibur calcium-binding domain